MCIITNLIEEWPRKCTVWLEPEVQKCGTTNRERNNTSSSFCRWPGYYSTRWSLCRIYDKKLIEEYLRWGLHVSILKIEYVNVGSYIQNIKLENNIEIKGNRSFMYLGFIFMNPGKCNEEVLNTNEQASRATKALNSLLRSKYISVNIKK